MWKGVILAIKMVDEKDGYEMMTMVEWQDVYRKVVEADDNRVCYSEQKTEKQSKKKYSRVADVNVNSVWWHMNMMRWRRWQEVEEEALNLKISSFLYTFSVLYLYIKLYSLGK